MKPWRFWVISICGVVNACASSDSDSAFPEPKDPIHIGSQPHPDAAALPDSSALLDVRADTAALPTDAALVDRPSEGCTATIQGSARGLYGPLVLETARGDSVKISADGPFAFPSAVPCGQAYSVAVRRQPTEPKQWCDLTAPTGTAQMDAGAPKLIVRCHIESCAGLRKARPDLPTATYSVDPDGEGAALKPMPVQCEMYTAGGGWTLVGLELPNTIGTFRFLGSENGSPEGIAAGSESGLIGRRFSGKYREVWIGWGASATQNHIRFQFGAPAFDMFANVINAAVPIDGLSVSDQSFSNWVFEASGAVFCQAARSPDVRPGDTSWAVKPRNDTLSACGCSDPSWQGRGAYYGGSADQTSCSAYPGGWAGVRDNGVAKGGITPSWATWIFVR